LRITTHCSLVSFIYESIRQYVNTGKCSYIDPQSKKQCCSQHQLEIDHLQPIYAGGPSDDIENLRILCRRHNQNRAPKA
ncbi:MAG: HNH endonuclease, partial [Pseudobdellovibrionaceae bacterium]